MRRIVVLTSGVDSTLPTLIDNTASGDLEVEITAVIADEDDSPGLLAAASAGIESHTLSLEDVLSDGGNRDGFDVELAGMVASFQPDLVVVTGRAIELGDGFVERLPGSIVRAHPAMPGAFPGSDAVSRAYAAFAGGEIKRTGVTVHRLGPEPGERAVVTLEPVPIFAGEPIEELEARVRLVEDNLILAAVHLLLGDS